MKKKILFLGTLFLALGVVAAELENGDFEDGFTGWTVKGTVFSIDNSAPFGKGALKITQPQPVWQRIFQEVAVEPSTEYEFEYYVKCQDVVPQKEAKFAGASVGISKKVDFPLQGSGGAWKLDVGTCAWKKVTFRFKTVPEEQTITVQLQLTNASGTVWFDGLTLRKADDAAKKSQAVLQAPLYPLEFLQKTPFHIAENLLGALMLKPKSTQKISSNLPAEMVWEVPDFIKISGGMQNIAMTAAEQEGKRIYTTYKITEKGTQITRNGHSYRRYRLALDERFLHYLNTSWFSHTIFLKAQPGSVGMRGTIFWRITAGQHSSDEASGEVEIIPAIQPSAKTCEKFGLMLATPPILLIPNHPEYRNMADFWLKLAKRPMVWGALYSMIPSEFEAMPTVCGGCWTLLAKLQPQLDQLRRELPQNINDRGKPHHGFAVWSKVDDLSGNVEKFLRNGVRELVRLNPDLRQVVWDFEPHPYGYDAGGRARFAKQLKLKTVPSIEETTTKYTNEWFQYMVELHAQYINKVVQIFHEEAPEIKFWLCSDNLYAAPPHISFWCGVDVRKSDAVVDGHMHMPYYTGKRFFDDVQFNVQNLKKPFFPLIDPAEALFSYYRQYLPEKVLQNILVAAAVGCTGIGFWPSDCFTADYYKAIADAYGIIANNEDFFFQGERCEKEFTFEPVNVVRKQLTDNNGKPTTIFFPDFPSTLRYTAHKLGNDFLFTLFNYHEEHSVILRITGKGRSILAEIPANGAIVFRASKSPVQAPLQQKIRNFAQSGNSNQFPELRDGKCSLEWCAGKHGEPLLRLANGKIQAMVDATSSGQVKELYDAAGNPILHNGFLARVIFFDQHQPQLVFDKPQLKITDGQPSLELQSTVGAYPGANPVPNPLLHMIVKVRYALSDHQLKVDFTFTNPTAMAMPLGFRINNYPMPGLRFGATPTVTLNGDGIVTTATYVNNKFLRKTAASPFFARQKTALWDGDAINLHAAKGNLHEDMVVVPDQSFAGVFFGMTQSTTTVELVTPAANLQPNSSKSYTYTINLK